MTTPSKPIIVVLDALSESSRKKLHAACPEGYLLRIADSREPEHLFALVAEATHAISGQIAVSADLMKAAPRLRSVHKWGVGVDNIDVDAAARLGIAVARQAGGNAIPVAEYTVGLMISTLRNLAWGHATMREGKWLNRSLPHDPLMLHQRTVGLIGFGATGQQVARRLSGFDCRILYTQRHRAAREIEQALQATYTTFDALIAESDVISLHCPLTDQTRGLINEAVLRRMKPSAVLINVARGGVVVESDLAKVLREGVILGAASDVFEAEPLAPDSPLQAIDNFGTSPHMAAMSFDNVAPTATRMMANILRLDRGETLPEGDLVVAPGIRPDTPH
mgnify:CR=1 FL=1